MRAPVLLTSLLIGTVCILAYYLPSAPPHGQYDAAPCRGVVPAKTCGGKFANLNELHTSQSVTIAAGIDHIAILGRHDEQVQQIVTRIRSILVEHHAQIKGNEQELEAAACACGGMTEKDTTVLYTIGKLLGRIERLIVQYTPLDREAAQSPLAASSNGTKTHLGKKGSSSRGARVYAA